jgi:hypothetical protein
MAKTRSSNEGLCVAGPATCYDFYEVPTNLDRREGKRDFELEERRRAEEPVRYDFEKDVKIDMPIVLPGIYQQNGNDQRFEV